jgi:hypothetical protein
VEIDEWVFSFFLLSMSYGLSFAIMSPEVVLPGDWLMSSILFHLSTGQVAFGA